MDNYLAAQHWLRVRRVSLSEPDDRPRRTLASGTHCGGNRQCHPADFAALAQPLNLPEKDSRDQELVIDAVREWLEKHDGWLLLFDNVMDPDDLYRYLPRTEKGQILVTSGNTAEESCGAIAHRSLSTR